MGGKVGRLDERIKKKKRSLTESTVRFSKERRKEGDKGRDNRRKGEGEGGDSERNEGSDSSETNNFIFEAGEEEGERGGEKVGREMVTESGKKDTHTFNGTFFYFTIYLCLFQFPSYCLIKGVQKSNKRRRRKRRRRH